MNESTKAFIKEYKENLEWKKNNGPIDMTVDQLWKYSVESEETSKDFEEYDVYFAKYYRKKIQNKDIYILLNNKESLIVDYFYRNSNSSLEQMSEDLQVPVTTITQTISKHLKIQQNESRNNKSNDSKS